MASLATAARLLTIPDGPSSRVRTIALIIGAFTLVYRYCLRAKGDWNGLEPPHKLIDSLYFSATVFSAPPARPRPPFSSSRCGKPSPRPDPARLSPRAVSRAASMGFGDISPKSSRAKLTVLCQMATLLWSTL